MHRKTLFRIFWKNRTTSIGTMLIVIVFFVAIFAPLLSPYDPITQDVVNRLAPPQISHPLGTDDLGRDILSRIIHGARMTMLISFISVLFGMFLGVNVGLVTAYKGGLLEKGVSMVVDVLLSFPTLVLGLIIIAVSGPGVYNLIMAIGLAMAPRFYRLAYAPAISVMQENYIEACRSVGLGDLKIIFRHIFPNIQGNLLIMGTIWLGTAIGIEANLSFLGLGINPPTPTWGQMISDGLKHMYNAPWISLFPGMAILLTVLSFNLFGDGLRDLTDPRLRG